MPRVEFPSYLNKEEVFQSILRHETMMKKSLEGIPVVAGEVP